MRVTAKLFAQLRKHLPAGADPSGIPVELPDGATVGDLIDRLGFPRDHAGIIVSGDQHLEVGSRLKDGQEVSLFPPLAGGT
jgi:molybdopterin converting factor small subunit